MGHRAAAALVVAGVFAAVGCRAPAPEPSRQEPPGADAGTRALLEGMGAAVASRDYATAYDALAAEAKASVSLAEFEEAFRHYRDALPDGLEVRVSVDAYDPDSAGLVPEELRDRVVAEGAVEFVPGGDLEGFSAVVWVMPESGKPRIAAFYVGD